MLDVIELFITGPLYIKTSLIGALLMCLGVLNWFASSRWKKEITVGTILLMDAMALILAGCVYVLYQCYIILPGAFAHPENVDTDLSLGTIKLICFAFVAFVVIIALITIGVMLFVLVATWEVCANPFEKILLPFMMIGLMAGILFVLFFAVAGFALALQPDESNRY